MPDLLSADLSLPKTFVTGIYGSGKSTIAYKVAVHTERPYKNFDALWNYRVSVRPEVGPGYAENHFKRLGAQFSVDAIAFNPLPDLYTSFSTFYDSRPGEILIICALCMSTDEWFERLRAKKTRNSEPAHLRNYTDFHTKYLPMHNGRNILYYDTVSEQYVSLQDVEKHIQEVTQEI